MAEHVSNGFVENVKSDKATEFWHTPPEHMSNVVSNGFKNVKSVKTTGHWHTPTRKVMDQMACGCFFSFTL